MLLAVLWEVWRAIAKVAAPRATPTHFTCSQNFPRASITQCMQAKYEQILYFILIISFFNKAPLEDGRIDTN